MPRTPSRSARGSVAFAIVLLLSACGDERQPEASSARSVSSGSTTGVLSQGLTVEPVPACGTGAHDKHSARGVTCATCHPCGGVFGFGAFEYSGGTSTDGGVMTRNEQGTTCSVGCHSPLGAQPTTVSWSAGPLPCTACHSNVVPEDVSSVRSGHFVGVTDPSTVSCASCHDNASHTSGEVVLVVGDASQGGACVSCHDGDGQTIAGATPPLLVGWTDAVAGDFHGSRAGTGYGGTLRAPYARGQAPLSCKACHDAHASTNEFLPASIVNGVAIPPRTIGRAGVGAEALCNACHQGDRHAGCKACHTAVKLDLGDGHVWFDSSAPPVDPAPPGYPCFWCHGHEGIVNWTKPGSLSDDMTRPWNESCDHCHSFRAPIVETAAPVVLATGPITVTGNDPTSVTVTWTTDESSTSYVEYGVTTANRVASGAPGRAHSVTIGGLTPGASYVYRVRSSDPYRNVLQSPLATFATSLANAPLAPTLVQTPGQLAPEDELTFVMRWNPVTAPDGDPVEYRLVVAEYPTFPSLVIDTGWISQTSYTASLSTHGATGSYFWRVMARDALHDVSSQWSSVESFYAWDSRDE